MAAGLPQATQGPAPQGDKWALPVRAEGLRTFYLERSTRQSPSAHLITDTLAPMSWMRMDKVSKDVRIKKRILQSRKGCTPPAQHKSSQKASNFQPEPTTMAWGLDSHSLYANYPNLQTPPAVATMDFGRSPLHGSKVGGKYCCCLVRSPLPFKESGKIGHGVVKFRPGQKHASTTHHSQPLLVCGTPKPVEGS